MPEATEALPSLGVRIAREFSRYFNNRAFASTEDARAITVGTSRSIDWTRAGPLLKFMSCFRLIWDLHPVSAAMREGAGKRF
jgi:hypothetical protein